MRKAPGIPGNSARIRFSVSPRAEGGNIFVSLQNISQEQQSHTGSVCVCVYQVCYWLSLPGGNNFIEREREKERGTDIKVLFFLFFLLYLCRPIQIGIKPPARESSS